MLYKFKGVDKEGKIVKGNLEEQCQWKAIEKLSEQGISCIYCKSKCDKSVERLKGKISSKDLTLLCRSLKNNLKSGIPIVTSLKLLSERVKRRKFSNIVKNVANQIEGGETFTEALKSCSGIFPPIFLSMIKIGEDSGNLEPMLEKMNNYFSAEDKRRKNIRSSMIYPMLIFSVAAIGAIVIITKFMPSFLSNMKIDTSKLPEITKFYMFLSDLMVRLDFFMVPIGITLFLLGGFLIKKLKSSNYIEKVKYTGLFTKDIYMKNFNCRFTMALYMIMSCGIDIKGAFYLLHTTENSRFIKEKYMTAIEQLEQGQGFGKVIDSFGLFPEEFLTSIYLGEESGDIHETLIIYNDIFEEDLKSKLEVFIKLLEPTLIAFAALFLLSIYVAVIIPIYSVYSN